MTNVLAMVSPMTAQLPLVTELGGALLRGLEAVPPTKRPLSLQAAQAAFDELRHLRGDTHPFPGLCFRLMETMPPYRRDYTRLRQPALLLSSRDPIGVLLVTARPEDIAFQLAAVGETQPGEPLPAGLLVYVMGDGDEAGMRFYADVSRILAPTVDGSDPGKSLQLARRVADKDRTYWVANRSLKRKEVAIRGYLAMEATTEILARIESLPDTDSHPPLSLRQPIGPFLLRLKMPLLQLAVQTRVGRLILRECFSRGLTHLEELRQLITADGLAVEHLGPEAGQAFLAALGACGLQVRNGAWFDPPPEPTDGEQGPDLLTLTVAQLRAELQARPERMPPQSFVETLTCYGSEYYGSFSKRTMDECLRQLAAWGKEMPIHDLFDDNARTKAEAWRYYESKVIKKDLTFLQILLWWNGIWQPWKKN